MSMTLMQFMKLNPTLPPFVAMQKFNDAALACKCANGYHTVITNSLLGQEPTCTCEADIIQPLTPSATNPKCDALNAGAINQPYKYIWNGQNCVRIVDYDYIAANGNTSGGGAGLPFLQNTSIGNTLSNLWVNHKIAILAALAIGGYYLTQGGLAAESRTVTSVSRFAPRRNGRKSSRRKRR